MLVLICHVIAHSGLQLRDIEILAQQQIETLEADGKDDHTLREIQKILYSTEVRPPCASAFTVHQF